MKFDHLFFEGAVAVEERRAPRFEEKRARPVPAAPAPEVTEFFACLLATAALPADAYRSRALTRRLPACLRFLRVNTVEEAMRRLKAEPALATAALNVALLGVTEFFRDRAVFDALRGAVLPELLARQRAVRVWSAACSEGHELYSIAMLLAEAGRLQGSQLLGTDCRLDAIAAARSGAFGPESLGRLDEARRTRYFTPTRGWATIDPVLRGAVEWRVADLLHSAERGPWDLILWRNMAIYLESDAAEEIWLRLCGELAGGGYLVTGKADHLPKWLPLERVAPCIYRKAEGRR